MTKFTAKVIEGYRITIIEAARGVEGIEVGDLVEVDVVLAKKAEK